MHSVSKRRRLSPNMVIDDKKKYPVNRDFVVCEGLYEKCFSKFNEMRSNQQLCDVKLKTKNGDIIWAHKVVLAANSEYFNIMFNGQFKESRVAEIVIQQLDVFILNLLIDFIYTSKLFISEQNIHEILNGICLLQFNEQVQNQCFNYIKTRVNPNNCLGIKEITEHLGLQELCSFCLKYIFILYRKVIEHDEFVFITFEEILQIIKSEELCVSEELVYKSVLKWTVHDLANRTKHLPVLLNYVRLLNISTSFMKSITQKEPFLKLNSKCVKYLSKAFALQQENNAILNLTYSISIPFRPNYSEYILILNKVGENNNRSLLFNAISKKWKYIDLRFPSIPSIASYVLNDSRIIHLAGCQLLNSQTNAVLRPYFDDYSKAVIQELGDRKVNLTTTTPMNEIHNENNIVQIGSKIYVVCYYNSEYYDIVEDKWFKMKCSTNVRTSCSVIAFGGYIYAIGGNIGRSDTNLVEKYNPETAEWTTVSPMKYKRRSVSLCVLNDCIYAIGGAGRVSTFLKEVEKYNPITDTWEDVVSLKHGRNTAGAASINGYLYVFGGGNKIYTIEKYCPFKKNWTVLELRIPKAFGRTTTCTAFTIRREHQHKFLSFCQTKFRFEIGSN